MPSEATKHAEGELDTEPSRDEGSRVGTHATSVKADISFEFILEIANDIGHDASFGRILAA